MPLQATSGAASYDAFGGGVPVEPNYIEQIFSTYLYTGNGSTQTITNGIDLSTKGGLVWYKARALAYEHQLVDTARGAGFNLETPNTSAQASRPTALTAFNTTGFTLGSNAAANGSGDNFVSWTFRKQPKFFDVVTFVKDSSTNQRISHSLDSVPACIIVKRVTSADDWYVYHRSLGGLNKWISLNSTGAVSTTSGAWGSSNPTTTDFGVSTNLLYDGGGTPLTYVAYLFAHDAGGFGLTGTDNVISCGSYTGNGSATGTIVTLGYEPQWVMVKRATVSTGSWEMFDSMRGFTMEADAVLRADTSGAEFSLQRINPTSTGFQLADSDGDVNANGSTYIYIAIRRGPMKVPTDATKVFAPTTAVQTLNTISSPSAGFPVDMQFTKPRSIVDPWDDVDRLRGSAWLIPNQTDQEYTSAGLITFDSMTAVNYTGNFSGSSTSRLFLNFKRAPSFFDEVCYTGTGSAQALTHNLAAVPEMMIVKRRDSATAGSWFVYTSFIGNGGYVALNYTTAADYWINIWNDTTPTSTQFTVGSYLSQSGGTHVAYLFATCAGVSKVGSYTGTGATQTINCGFGASGSRFVLIKRTDSTGDWYVWDSARGMVSGTDPSLLLNSTAAEVNANSVYAVSTGFQIVSTAAGINASGGSYIFLSIS